MPKLPVQDDGDGWSRDGRNILSADRLAAIRNVLDNKAPVVVEHWFYSGSCAPDRLVFDDYENFVNYLASTARPGDAIHVWDFGEVCRDDNTLADGEYPDDQGRTPARGAY